MNRRREKLLNAILYFAQNTKLFGVTKMMKLLSFYEFEVCKQVGFPPIGLDYYAYQNGPLPFDFWITVKDHNLPLPEDISRNLTRERVSYSEAACGSLFVPKPDAQLNFDVFSPREKEILKDLAEKYEYTSAKDMSEISHEDGRPWQKTISEKGEKERIDYTFSLDEDSDIELNYAREATRQYISVNDSLGNYAISPLDECAW